MYKYNIGDLVLVHEASTLFSNLGPIKLNKILTIIEFSTYAWENGPSYLVEGNYHVFESD